MSGIVAVNMADSFLHRTNHFNRKNIIQVLGSPVLLRSRNRIRNQCFGCFIRDYNNAQKFLDEVDAAAVYVNASTRFTDGFEFGFGAEIGISTQKLHARGPMGLLALTSTKYIIYGNGQIRP